MSNLSLNNESVTAVVLAAGAGRRMGSSLPKVLHPVAGKPMLARILQALKQAGLTKIHVVINPDYDRLIRPVAEAFKGKVFFQEKQKGTAVAVKCGGLETASDQILIVNGDHPLIQPEDLKNLIHAFNKQSADMAIGVFKTDYPAEYGRIVRDGRQVVRIVEKESTPGESPSQEINTGIYLIKKPLLIQYLPQILHKDLNKECYLTDIVALLVAEGKKVISQAMSADTAGGVNSGRALALATKKIFTRKIYHLMEQGVMIIDPLNVYIEEDVQVAEGCVIYPGVYLKGRTAIGPFSAIEMNCFIADSVIHRSVLVRAGSYLESVEVGEASQVGPYARLRPGTKIGERCKVGNFVEMKKTSFGAKSRAGHFCYLGDTKVGEDANIGCGVITCNLNLDGKKHDTHIGHKAFVGSGTELVAPVTLGDHSVTGAGVGYYRGCAARIPGPGTHATKKSFKKI